MEDLHFPPQITPQLLLNTLTLCLPIPQEQDSFGEKKRNNEKGHLLWKATNYYVLHLVHVDFQQASYAHNPMGRFINLATQQGSAREENATSVLLDHSLIYKFNPLPLKR